MSVKIIHRKSKIKMYKCCQTDILSARSVSFLKQICQIFCRSGNWPDILKIFFWQILIFSLEVPYDLAYYSYTVTFKFITLATPFKLYPVQWHFNDNAYLYIWLVIGYNMLSLIMPFLYCKITSLHFINRLKFENVF